MLNELFNVLERNLMDIGFEDYLIELNTLRITFHVSRFTACKISISFESE